MPEFPRGIVSNADCRNHFLLGVVVSSVMLLASAPSYATDEDQRAGTGAPAASSSRAGDVVKPIYYPHSPRERLEAARSSDEINELLDEFLHLHSTMQYDAALNVIDALIDREPDNAVMHYNRACVLGRLLRTSEAIDALERAVELGWRNLSHLQVDPDLRSIRWSGRYEQLTERLAAKIRREQPSSGPLRDDPWEAIVRDLQAVAPNLLASNDRSHVTISLVHDGAHVWTGTFSGVTEATEDAEKPAHKPVDSQRTYHVEGPAHLLGMLAVLQRWDGQAEPGVVRLVQLVRHAARAEAAVAQPARPVGRRTGTADRHADREGTSGPFAPSARESATGSNRAVVGGRVMRVSHVPDDVHDLFRMTVEYLSGDSFIRHCRQQVFPAIGMSRSDLVTVGVQRHRQARRVSRGADSTTDATTGPASWEGPPRMVLKTTADDLAALLAHVLNMERSTSKGMLDWQQVSDHLLRSCVTRTLTIGSGMTIRRTPFGIRTDVVSGGGGHGCVMRWYPQSGSGVVILFDEDASGAGRRTAERLAHLALGGQS